MIENLTLIGVGLAKHIALNLSPRLNVITGDNGFGKTFLLDCAWWALTGQWANPEIPAYPRLDSTKPAIEFRVSGNSKRVAFDKTTQRWPLSNEQHPVSSNLVLYARDDGSYIIWDLVRHSTNMPYEAVPVISLSTGSKRISNLAYLLVWTWETHKVASKTIDKAPQSKLTFLIDDIEAHLHPQWQRVIVPTLLNVVKTLEQQLEVQFIIATHSPLVLASVEPLFQDKLDSLFTLDLVEQELIAKELQYIKYGSINSWLTSEVFNLRRPYSIDAEKALVDAKELQMTDHPDPEKIKEVSARLAQYLPAIDPIWPRWTFFAEKNGVDL